VPLARDEVADGDQCRLPSASGLAVREVRAQVNNSRRARAVFAAAAPGPGAVGEHNARVAERFPDCWATGMPTVDIAAVD
jgi:hypothetical protein